MSRLRRVRREANSLPLAAEVCEARALLSSAAAVHMAIHHAQASVAGPTASPGNAAIQPAVTMANFQVTYEAPDPDPKDPGTVSFPGTLSISPVLLKVGARVTVTGSATADLGGPTLMTMKLSGKVQSWAPQGVTTNVTLKATGSVTLERSPATTPFPHLVYHATNPLLINLDETGTFSVLQDNFTHPPIHNVFFLPIELLAHT